MFAKEMYDRGGASDETKHARALYHINSILEHNQLNNETVGLEKPDQDSLAFDNENWREWHEAAGVEISMEEAEEQAELMASKMNDDQLRAFHTITEAIYQKIQGGEKTNRLYFLQGPGGTGKTFVYRAIYNATIALGGKVLMVAHTGIAATLLINGSTVHRQFCIPISANGDSKCQVAAESRMEEQIRDADVIIWDEAAMSDKRVLHCVEKVLCEIEVTTQESFGGKLMLLGGDWKQLLPVVRSTFGAQILDYTLKKSHLWQNFEVLNLTKNMRLEEGSDKFAVFLDKVGRADRSIQDAEGYIAMMADSVEEVIDYIYGGGGLRVEDADDIKDSCILTPLNESTFEINNKVLDMLEGETFTSKSVDKCSKESRYMEMPVEMYNRVTPIGMPPHELRLKKGCIVMLLRNLNVSQGQCNGTRLRVINVTEHLLTCEIITSGRFENKIVLIPKIEMEPSDQTDPSHCFKRLQFPLRLAYAMTINKSQGQSLSKVGIILTTPVFSHGQLYVALSRARTEAGVKIYQPPPEDEEGTCNNIVYNKVFTEILD